MATLSTEEQRLYRKHVRAEHAYLKCLRDRVRPEFAQHTAGKVLDIVTFPWLAMNEKQDPNDSHRDSLVRKLSLLCHPDKCEASDATDLFCLVQNADLEILEAADKSSSPLDYLRGRMHPIVDQEKEIQLWKAQVWYQWFRAPSMVDGWFITPQDLRDKLQRDNSRLEQENEQLRQELAHKLKQ